MFGFDPISIGVGVLVWLAFKKQSGTQFGAMTAEREDLFRNAMAHCADPKKLAFLANEFKKEGLKAEAWALKKRAEWRGRSEDVRAAHASIFERALNSENATAILSVAAAFEDMTATVKAKQLRERAQMLNEQALKKHAEAEEAKAKESAAKLKPESNGAAKKAESIPGNTAEESATE
jgi:hypothetical protein